MPDLCPMCRTQLADGSRFCHKCGVPLGGEAPAAGNRAQPATVVRILILLSWLACVVGTFLIAAMDIETILGSGPTLAGLGLLTCLAGLWASMRRACIVGLVHMGLCLLVLLLIMGLRWTPGQAQHPVLAIAFVYTLAAACLTIWALIEPARRLNPWVCVQCGYLLRGLTEPRCPECGTPFDPKLLTGYPPNQGDPPRKS